MGFSFYYSLNLIQSRGLLVKTDTIHMNIAQIMKLLAQLVELNEKITTACHKMWDAEWGQADEYAEERLTLEDEANNIYGKAMELAHIIGCTIWCDAKHDHINYQLICAKGRVVDQTR